MPKQRHLLAQREGRRRNEVLVQMRPRHLQDPTQPKHLQDLMQSTKYLSIFVTLLKLNSFQYYLHIDLKQQEWTLLGPRVEVIRRHQKPRWTHIEHQ